MERVADFPYFEVQFDKRGQVVDQDEVDALVEHVAGSGASDLLVVSHGWNNDMERARELYHDLLTSVRHQLPAVPGAADRDLSVMAVLWPSKKFAERDFIPGGAAGFGDPGDEVGEDDLRAQLDELQGAFDSAEADAALEEAKGLVDRLEGDRQAQQRFVNLLRENVLPRDDARQDPETAAELPAELWELPGDQVLERLSEEPDEEIDFDAGGAAGGIGGGAGAGVGGAAGFGEFFGSIKAGAQNLLNKLTYYKMKNRAGVVGAGGVYDVLGELRRSKADLRLHLVGHSFGGRLVSAAAKGPEGKPVIEVDSISLLQAAFSHYGFADQWDPPEESPGFFRRVLTDPRLRGPMVVTHTVNDRAVGIAYALASRLARQVAAAIGDENDIYGGIGRNGALETPEAERLRMLPTGGAGYVLTAGRVYNLQADDFIPDHSGVTGQEVAFAILHAVAAS